MDFWEEYEKRLKKANYPQRFYDVQKRLFSKMVVKNFIKMYPEEWGERINASQYDFYSPEDDVADAHKIASDLYDEILFKEKMVKSQEKYDELRQSMKSIHDQQLSQIRTIGRDKPRDDRRNWQIKGSVYDKEAKKPIEGLTVKVFGVNHLKDDDSVGESVTNIIGEFKILLNKSSSTEHIFANLKKGVNLLLKFYDSSKKLLHIEKLVFDNITSKEFIIELENSKSKYPSYNNALEILPHIKNDKVVLSENKIKIIDSCISNLHNILSDKNDVVQKELSIKLVALKKALQMSDIELGLHIIEDVYHDKKILKSDRKEINMARTKISNLRLYHPENYYQYRFITKTDHEEEMLSRVRGPEWKLLFNARIALNRGHEAFNTNNYSLAIMYYRDAKKHLSQINEIAKYEDHKYLTFRFENVIGLLIYRRFINNVHTLCGTLQEYAWHAIFEREEQTAPYPNTWEGRPCELPLHDVGESHPDIEAQVHNFFTYPLEFGMLNLQFNYPYIVTLHIFIIDLAIAESYIEMGNFDQGILILTSIAANRYINIPIEQNYVRCQLMRAYLQKADSHYRRNELEEAKYNYENVFSIYKETGEEISRSYKLSLNLENNIIDLNDWHEDDKRIYKELTDNPIALYYLNAAAMRLLQIRNNLNYLGYSDDYFPIWSYEFLDAQARNLINTAQRHESAYLNALQERDKQHELLRNLEQQLFISLSEKIISQQETLYSEGIKRDLERQFDEYGEYPGDDPSKILNKFYWLRANTFAKTTEDRNTEIINSVSSIFGISGSSSPGVSVSVSPSGIAGIFTSMMRYQANVDVQKAQFDYEFAQLLSKKYSIFSQKSLAEIQVIISKAKERIAEFRVASLEEDLAYQKNKTLNEEFWWKMSQHARDFVIWYIEKANLVAFLAEQAYEFENDTKMNVIRYDYSKAKFGELYGADQLLRDLDTIRVNDIVSSKKEILIKHVVSIRERHPILLESFRYTGNVGFPTLLQELDLRYPGVYKVQIKNLEISLIGSLSGSGIKGYIRNVGHSLIRSKSSSHTKGYLEIDDLRRTNPYNYWENGLFHVDWYLKTKFRISAFEHDASDIYSRKSIYYFVYAVDVASNTICLGGNKQGVDTKTPWNYFVIVPGDVDVTAFRIDPNSQQREAIEVAKVKKNTDGTFNQETLKVYTDKDVRVLTGNFETTDSVLEDAWIVRTNNKDCDEKVDRLIMLNFKRRQNLRDETPITIYVAYDARAQSLPQWLLPYEIQTRVDPAETLILSMYDIRHDSVILSGESGKKGVFEGVGYGTWWELEVPRTENKFNYSTVFDIQISFYLKAYYDAALAERINAAKNRLYAKPEYTKRNIAFSLKMDFPDMYYHLKNDKRVATLKDSLTNLVGIGEAAFTFEIKESHCPFIAGDFICIDNEILRIKSEDENRITVTTSTSRGGIGTPNPPGSRLRITYFGTQSGHHESGAAIYALPVVYFDILDSFFPHNEKGPNNDIDRKLLNISLYFSFKKEFTYPSDYDDTVLQNQPIPIPFYLTYAENIDLAPIKRMSNLLYAVRKYETIGEAPNETAVIVPRNPKARLFSEEKNNEFFSQESAQYQLNPCAKYGIVFRLPDGFAVEDIEDIIINIEYSITPII